MSTLLTISTTRQTNKTKKTSQLTENQTLQASAFKPNKQAKIYNQTRNINTTNKPPQKTAKQIKITNANQQLYKTTIYIIANTPTLLQNTTGIQRK